MDITVSRRCFIATNVLGASAGTLIAEAGTSGAVAKAPESSGDAITVAACQILTHRDLDANMRKIMDWIDTAAAAHVDVVAFPEASLPGYVADLEHYESLGRTRVEAAEQEILAHARKAGIALVLGTAHWDGGTLYNSLLIADKDGAVRGRYSKVFLAEGWCASGRTLPVFMLAGVPTCFIICHDVRYPELVRLPSIAGAQLCFFCSHESGLTKEYKLSAYRAMPIARATENSIFLVMANAPASPKDLSGSHGNSKIIHPDGNVLVEAGYFEERLVTTSIQLDQADRSIAEKCVAQPSILTKWLVDGTRLVTLPV